MMLLPKPQSLKLEKGCFNIKFNTRILLDSKLSNIDFESAKFLKKEIFSYTGFNLAIVKTLNCYESDYIHLKYNDFEDNEQYTLKVGENGIIIEAAHNTGLFYGITTLCQLIKSSSTQINCVIIEDKPYFKNRAYLLDITRGRVPSLSTIKELVDRLSFYKINQLQLYIEHTFAFKKHSEVWSKTDPITAEEILEIDQYCIIKGIELVPCIATFGHLYDTLSSNSFNHLSEMDKEVGEPFTWFHRMRYHILNASDPNSFEFVKSMFDEYMVLFSSNKFNICCDETFDLGKGKSTKSVEDHDYGKVYMQFVNKLISYLESQGKQVMMWGDIVLKNHKCIPEIPKTVTCLNWFYSYQADYKNVKIFKDYDIIQYVCPSVSGFSRIVNEMDMSFTNIKDMISLGKKYDAIGVLNTDWGDSGHINHLASSIPGMIYGAALSWNPDDERSFVEIDKSVSLIEYGDHTYKLISLIRELSKQDIIIFNNFAFFRDYKMYNLQYNVFETCLYENTKKEIMDSDEINLYDASLKAEKIYLDIFKHSFNINEKRNQDMREYYLSARGVHLMQSLALIIKKYEYNQAVTKLVNKPYELAEKFEYWLFDYCAVWRERNKEGELFRIKEFVSDICNILRRYV